MLVKEKIDPELDKVCIYWKDGNYLQYDYWVPLESKEAVKKVIRLTYKVFFWISLFLLLPTISYYFVDLAILKYSRDIGIVIVFVVLWKITKRMKKKEVIENNKNRS